MSVNYESGRLAPDSVRRMFDRIAPVYDAMNRTMTAGLDRRWRRLTAEAVVHPGDEVLDACCGTGDLAIAGAAAGGRVTGLDFSEPMLERARRKAPSLEWIRGRRARAALRGCELRRGDRGLRRSERRRPAARPRRAAPRSPSRRTAGHPRDHPPPRGPCALLSLLVRQSRAVARQAVARWVCLHVSPGERAALPWARGAGGADRRGRLSRGPLPALRRAASSRCTRRKRFERTRGDPRGARAGRLPRRARGPSGARGRCVPRRRRGGRCGGAGRRREAAAAAARVPLGAARVGAACRRRRRRRAHPPRDAHARRPHRPRLPASRPRLGLVGARPRGGASSRRLPLRACVRRARGHGKRRGARDPRERDALPRPR